MVRQVDGATQCIQPQGVGARPEGSEISPTPPPPSLVLVGVQRGLEEVEPRLDKGFSFSHGATHIT